jgi:Ser/Thr protein kinase RdoA (MazF antagonist)
MKPLPAGLRTFVKGHVGAYALSGYRRQANTKVDLWALEAGSGEDYFVKLFSSASRAFQRERHAYRAWASQLHPVTPRLVASSTGLTPGPLRGLAGRAAAKLARRNRRGPPAALLLTAVPGVPAEEATLPREEELEAHRQAGRFLRHLHGLPCQGDDFNARAAVERSADDLARRALGLVEPEVVDWVLGEIGQAPLDGLSRVPTHGDFGPWNWVIEDAGEALVLHVIDFGDACADIWLKDLIVLDLEVWADRPDLKTSFFEGYGRSLTAREEGQLHGLAALDVLDRLRWSRKRGDRDTEMRISSWITRLREARQRPAS